MIGSDDMAFGLADLPCAYLKTSKDRKIIFANAYFAERYVWDRGSLPGTSLSSLFSRASQAFCDSYVYPTAIAEPVCSEVQLTILTSAGERRPVVASVKQLSDGGFGWVFMEADNRDKLFRELEAAREALTEQTLLLESLSRTDALTGVLNRRGFDEGIRKIFADADRHGQPVTVLLMDIDHFKAINDVYGHQIGDDSLAALGRILQAICREQDLVGRFGGDEFACVLNQTDLDAARALCTRIHAAVAKAGAELGGFTVSIGVAGRAGHVSVPWSKVLSDADHALYKAKTAGRNSTVVHDGA